VQYEFDAFRLDVRERALWCEGQLVPLTPKLVETLLVLVERDGHIVDKRELMERVWPDTFVEEGNVARHVSLLRKTLAEWTDGPPLIETLPRRGYRLLAPVRRLSSPEALEDEVVVETHTITRVTAEERIQADDTAEVDVARQEIREPRLRAALPSVANATAALSVNPPRFFAPRPRRVLLTLGVLALIVISLVLTFGYFQPKTGGAIDSIAVLPFANQNHDAETEYLADGVTENIINNLTQLPNLRVIARNSAFRYKGKEADWLIAGQALGVRAVIVGRVQQRGENLLVSAELVDVRENKQLWGQQYNRKLADVFIVQGEIAQEISEKLRAKLSGAERQQLAKRPTENLKAFQSYTQGLAYSHRRTREDLLTAIGHYEKAIAEDRNYALAFAGAANAYASLGLYGFIAPSEGRRKAEEAAHKALALDENLAEAHTVLGQIYVHFTPYNFSLGDRELRHAIELSPSWALAHWYLGLSLVFQGRLDEAQAELLQARELDPLAPVIARSLALPPYFKRDYARALELLRQANELGPPFGTTFEIGVYIQNKLFNETLADLEKAKQERKNDPILIYGTGMLYAARGERAAALQIIQELEAMSGERLSQAHWIAKIYATLNEKELALTWLERGLAAGAIGSFYKDEPVWDPLRSDPRFVALLRQMGIKP
jgi:TolB-like protein/DNA-binding winged helix-turn-helix (wHTH) protein